MEYSSCNCDVTLRKWVSLLLNPIVTLKLIEYGAFGDLIPKAIFYLIKGDYKPQNRGTTKRLVQGYLRCVWTSSQDCAVGRG